MEAKVSEGTTILTEQQEAALRLALFHQIYRETPELANTERFARAIVASACCGIDRAAARMWLEIQALDAEFAESGASLAERLAARNESAAVALAQLGITPRQCWTGEEFEDGEEE